jgi:hypothetical protein
MSALGFEAQAIAAPDCSWSDLEFEFARLGREPWYAIVIKAATPEYLGVRARVLEALEDGEPSRRIADAHLRGYNRSRPGWIYDASGLIRRGRDDRNGDCIHDGAFLVEDATCRDRLSRLGRQCALLYAWKPEALR